MCFFDSLYMKRFGIIKNNVNLLIIKSYFYYRIFLLLLFVSCAISSVQAQGDCGFKMKVTTTIGTCYNNCKIDYAIFLDDGVTPLDTNAMTDLSDFKFFCINLLNNDTSYTFDSYYTVAPGQYKVGVQAICHNVGGGIGDAYTLVEQDTVVTTTTTYTTPVVSMIANIATSPISLGVVNSLTCENTGRLQLLITNGAFPYTVEVLDENEIPIDTITFVDRMYAGTNLNRYDYRDYYTFDSLAPGNYTFLVTDGCAYHLPKVWNTIETTQLPHISNVCWYFSSDHTSDSNVVKYAIDIEGMNANYQDKVLECLEWRLIYPEIDGVSDTTAWRHLSSVPTSNQVILYDTAFRAHRYCDLYGSPIKFESRNTLCEPYPYTTSYTYEPPIPSNFRFANALKIDSSKTIPAQYTPCGTTSKSEIFYGHYYPYIYYDYRINDYSSCSIGGSNYRNHHYTYPLYWVYTDTATHRVIKTESVPNIGVNSYLREEDVVPIYGDFRITPDTIPLQRTLYDGKGCELYSRNDIVVFKQQTHTQGGLYQERKFRIDRKDVSNYCCEETRSITFCSYNATVPMPLNGDCTVELIESPWNNKFNFHVTYNQSTQQWGPVVKEHLDNLATITMGEDNIYCTISDYCLPSGRYTFRVSTACDTNEITNTVSFNGNYEDEVNIYPEYELTNNCSQLTIRPIAGNYYYICNNTYTSGDHINEPYSDTMVLPAYFRVSPLDGQVGGCTSSTSVALNGTLAITMEGRYLLTMYPSSSSCTMSYVYDTIYFSGGTVEYKYSYAYVCDSLCVTGHVRAKGINGTPPYTYTLYSGHEMTGTVLGQNTTGVFDDVPLHDGQQISMKIEDACLASYHVNFFVFDLQKVNKCWFTDGIKVDETCEGSYINVYALEMGDEVTYSWTGPNGFHAETRDARVFIPRGAEEGWYYITLGNTGCMDLVRDSVYLHVKRAAQVHIADNANVCPGEEVTLTYTATGTGNVHYTIGHEENSIVTYQEYTNNSSFTYAPAASGIFWVKEVRDDNCSYDIPSDTIAVNLKTKVASGCDVVTIPDTVCLDSNAIVHAYSTLDVPYTLRWYRDYEQTTLLGEEVITSASQMSDYPFLHLSQDTAVYATVFNDEYCESKFGTIFYWTNMKNGSSDLRCGESMRFYDSGGVTGDYSKNESYRYTFTATDGQPITLEFNSFHTESVSDQMLVFKGTTTDEDSLIATLSGDLNSALPAPIVSNNGSMTIWFLSNGANQYAGWDATVSNTPRPSVATAHVLDSIKVELSPYTDVPVHYNGDITLQAVASGGRNQQFEYQWQSSADGITWTSVATIVMGDTSRQTFTTLTAPLYVRTIVRDASVDACGGADTAEYYIPIAYIKLELELSVNQSVPCTPNYTGTLVVRNTGHATAEDVVAHVQLPVGFFVDNQPDMFVPIGDLAGQDSVTLTFPIFQGYAVSGADNFAKAQIWSCLQGDSVPEVVYGDWDYAGFPRYVDEDTAKLLVKLPFDISDYHLTATGDEVCYGQPARLVATSDVAAPQYFYWYTDASMTDLIKIDTIHTTGQESSLEIPSLTERTVRYVAVANDNNCPAVQNGAVDDKFGIPVTDTVFMTNGSRMVGMNDHIRFYDSGGPNGVYQHNENLYYTFTAESGVLKVRINNFNCYTLDLLRIYDDIWLVSPMTIIYGNSSSRPLYITSATNSLTFNFHSYDYYGQYGGWDMEIINSQTIKTEAAEANVRIQYSENKSVAEGDIICYGEDAVLQAVASDAYPQVYSWYTIDGATLLQRDTISSGKSMLNLTNVTEDECFLVTVNPEGSCAVHPSTAATITTTTNIALSPYNNGDVVYVTPATQYLFTDAGGVGGSYSSTSMPNSIYTQTFVAVQGHVKAVFAPSGNYLDSRDTLYVYDGTISEENLLFKGSRDQYNERVFESTQNVLSFQFSSSNSSHQGWRATISSTSTFLFDTACVEIRKPLASSAITATDDTVCYDNTAHLTATSDIDYPQYYNWWDKDQTTILKRDTVTSAGSSFAPEHQISDSLYYVDVYNDANCPFVPSVYSQERILRNEIRFTYSYNSTQVGVLDSIPFYDEGGKDGYTSGFSGRRVFTAPPGYQVVLRIDTLSLPDDSDFSMIIRDGTSSPITSLDTLYGSGLHNLVYTSTTGVLDVNVRTSRGQMGWIGSVTTNYELRKIADAHVTIKSAQGASALSATDDVVCYDETAHLTATTSLTYPQYYNWWGSDQRTLLHSDTVYSAGDVSHFNPAHQIADSIYYVQAYDNTTCPYVPGVNGKTLISEYLMNETTVDTTLLTCGDSIGFYDYGGKISGTSYENNKFYYHIFKAELGRQVILHIDTLSLFNGGDSYLMIYDGVSATGTPITLRGNQRDLTYISTRGAFYIVHRSLNGHMGWEGSVTTDCADLTEAEVKVEPLPVVTINTDLPTSDSTCQGTSKTLSVTATATESGALSYQWYKDGTAIPGATSANYTVPITLGAGTYQYMVVVKATNATTGCSSADVTSTVCVFIVHQNPIVDINSLAQICPNVGMQDLSATISASTAAPYKYTWNSPDLTITPDTEQSSTSTTVTATAPIPTDCSGTYIVKLDVTDNNGCAATQADITLTVGVDDGIVISAADNDDTVQCISEVVYPHTVSPPIMPAVTDACGQSLSYTSVTSDTTNADCEGSVGFHYTFKDCAGHTATWDYTYYLRHTDAPVVNATGFRSDSTVTCESLALPLAATAVPTATDVCGNPLTGLLTSTEDVPSVITCSGTRTFTYTYTDCAGKTTTWQFVYTINDTVGPTFTRPNDTTYYMDATCNVVTDTAVTHSVPSSIVENCNSVVTVSYVDRDTVLPCGSTFEFDRVWRVVDECGNVSKSDSVQHITVLDTIKPTFKAPNDTTICRAAGGSISAPTTITGEPSDVADNCDAAPSVTWLDLDTTGIDLEIRIIHRQWTVSDGCNDSVIVQNISILPSAIAPGAVDFMCANDTIVNACFGETGSIVNLYEPTIVNHLSGMTYTLSRTPVAGYVFPIGTTTVTWTLTADNECGDFLTCTQDVTVTLPSCGTPADSAYIDDHAYSSVLIGNQCWTGENMRHTHYADHSTVDADTYADYDNDPANDEKFGKLYSWYAAMGLPEGDDATVVPVHSRGICPEGWAIPTVDEYVTMVTISGSIEYTRSPEEQYWVPSHLGIIPASGISFLARGAGYWNSETNTFDMLRANTAFWTNEAVSGTTVSTVELGGICDSANINSLPKDWKVSVRCIKLCE